MGVFSVPIRVSNWQNRFLPAGEHGEEIRCDAVAGSGAAQLALPADLVERLRLVELGTVQVTTADGGRHDCRVVGIAEIEVQGRSCQVRVLELPRGAQPLLGAVPLEEMDWHVAPLDRRLVPNPRSPDGPLLPLLAVAKF
ncbi:MAG: hypothetical protein HY744_29065 [Deltaproteobacteria bacterium]|nr:hypothetical protein [Deltaproteobacteria bacterium]